MGRKFLECPATRVRHAVCLVQALILCLLPILGQASDVGASVSYAIDKQNSLVRVYVYRAGLLTFLGHDHLVSTAAMDGGLLYTPPPSLDAIFKLTVPVAALVVDDPQQRKLVGGRFSGAVPAEARSGTRRNMLSDRVLAAEKYPEITINGHWIRGTASHGNVAATIGLHGVQREFIVPVDIQMQNSRLLAKGEFHLSQTEFDITPLSILGGVLKVADGVDVRFSLAFIPVDVPEQPSPQ
jgi:polyisoprenoid-binding protein YceI